VATHPTNADIIFVGTVNGGIWRTTNGTAASPNWTPLTDNQTSLSTGAFKFDPTDSTKNTLVAGVGLFSSDGRLGGARTGLLRTTNGGFGWSAINGGGTLTGKNIAGVAARGTTLVAAVDIADSFLCSTIGIFRSIDGGASFTQISGASGSGLPLGSAYDLAEDPSNTAVLYTAVDQADVCLAGAANGIYKSTDSGATWNLVGSTAMNALFGDNFNKDNAKITLGGSSNVYAAIVANNILSGLFRSGNGGTTWASLDLPTTTECGAAVFGIHPGKQGNLHLSVVADPTNANVVYIGGDRQPAFNEANSACGVTFPNSIGANNFSGRLFRVDASQAAGSQFTHLTNSNSLGPTGGGTASNSSPHGDSRGMAFDANGNLLEVDDGGIFRRTSPTDNTGDWFSINGNIQPTEFHDIAYDINSQIIIGGAQDTGTPQQDVPGGTSWTDVAQGDGGDVETTLTTTAGISLRYSSFFNLGSFRRRTYDAANVLQSTVSPALTVSSGAALQRQFYTPIKANAVDPSRLIIGGANSVYESLDQGDTISEVGAGIVANDDGRRKPLAYGGRLGGVNNTNVIWAGAVDKVWVRTAAAPAAFTDLTAYPGRLTGRRVAGVVLDPNDSNTAYVIDPSHVYKTSDTGTSWSDITGTLTGSFNSIEFVTIGSSRGIAVGTDTQVFVSLVGSLGTWNQLGSGLPNAPVYRLNFDSTRNLLVAGTLGRGAWTFNVIGSAPPSGVLVSGGSSAAGASLASAEIWGPNRGAFFPTSNMNVARSAHTVTVLQNGPSLIAGGISGGVATNSAEIFDPNRGAFFPTGKLNLARSSHTATLLQTGPILIAGGLAPATTASAEIFDPARGLFFPAASMNSARSGHAATLLNAGQVLITGGSGDNGAEIFDPARGAFFTTGPMNAVRTNHTATLLDGTHVLIAGGFDPGGAALTSAEIFDANRGRFFPTGNMNVARGSHTATLLSSGLVLITGGEQTLGGTAVKSAEVFDPSRGSFFPTGSMSTARGSHIAALVGNVVLVTGGTSNGTSAGDTNSAEIWDPIRGLFFATGPMNTARSVQAATPLQ
jgi:hypothetical protein